jgi:hypothetical protein
VPDWYRQGEVRYLVLQYYYALRHILHTHPDLRKNLTRCNHCGIFFLTDPRNAGRKDLRCPFGCREAHRKKSSISRSVAYYQEDEGKVKKRGLNNKRSNPKEQAQESHQEEVQKSSTTKIETPIKEEICNYIQMIVSLIEGRKIDKDEILKMLREKMRQHSFVNRRKYRYNFKYP